ncbi:MAG TPA: hypothetical protein PKK99_04760, partial [Bacteroidia bacterium]|nr:hypothetical protein [Bacteroidia bacterium]
LHQSIVRATPRTGAPVEYYGYQCWLTNYQDHPIVYARGIYGQYIIVIPDQRMIIVRLGKKQGQKIPPNRYSDMMVYVEGVMSAFANQ